MKLSNKIINKLIKKNISLSVIESCTGGLLTDTIIKNKGVSKIFKVGLITYSNESKSIYLNISKNIIQKYGAVSNNIADLMVSKLQKKEKSELTISTTGIAGPEGGTKNKPVGLVYIGIIYKKNKKIYKKNFKGSRRQIQKKVVEYIFAKINNLI